MHVPHWPCRKSAQNFLWFCLHLLTKYQPSFNLTDCKWSFPLYISHWPLFWTNFHGTDLRNPFKSDKNAERSVALRGTAKGSASASRTSEFPDVKRYRWVCLLQTCLNKTLDHTLARKNDAPMPNRYASHMWRCSFEVCVGMATSVCMFLCLCVCVVLFACLFAFFCGFVFVYLCSCVFVFAFLCLCICVFVFVLLCFCVFAFVALCLCFRVCVFVCVLVWVCVSVFVFVLLCLCVCVF